MESFADIYRDVCLLDLKYEHLSEVCRTVLQPWHNHDSFGKLESIQIAAQESKRVEATPVGVTEKEQHVTEKTVVPNKDDTHSTKELANLELLDSILTKAQRIRAVQPIESDEKSKSRKRTTKTSHTSMSVASQVYGDSKPSSKTFRHKTKTTSSKTKQPSSLGHVSMTTSAPSKDKHKLKRAQGSSSKCQVPSNKTKQHSKTEFVTSSQSSESFDLKQSMQTCISDGKVAEGSRGLSRVERGSSGGQLEREKNDEKKPEPINHFRIQTKGHRLSLPSRYTKLQKLLSRVNSQCGDRAVQCAVNKGADHFSKRLLNEESTSNGSIVCLLLALEEYSIIKEELQALTPKEWAVSDKSQWQDVLKVKNKQDSILANLQALKDELTEQCTHQLSYELPTHDDVQQLVDTIASHTIASSNRTIFPCTKHNEGKQLCSTVSERHPSEHRGKRMLSYGLKENSSLESPDSVLNSLTYIDLEKWRHLTLCEQQLLLQSWEDELIQYIDRSVLPFLLCHSDQFSQMCSLIQVIQRLVSSRGSISYVTTF